MRPYQRRRQRVPRDGHVSPGGVAGVLGVQEGFGDRLGHLILVSEPEERWFLPHNRGEKKVVQYNETKSKYKKARHMSRGRLL